MGLGGGVPWWVTWHVPERPLQRTEKKRRRRRRRRGRKAELLAEQLPDFSIHLPLGLIHLGDREKGDGGEEQGARKDPVRPCQHPGGPGPTRCPLPWPLFPCVDA